jgi:hypothetical protein
MPTPGEWREFQAWQMRERLAVRDALIAPKVAAPDPVVLVSSRGDQAQFAGRALPRTARSLVAVAEAAGWDVEERWSLVAMPDTMAGVGERKRVVPAHLLHWVSVRLRAYGVAAYALWKDPGGFERGAMISKTAGWQEIGVEALSKYVKGE